MQRTLLGLALLVGLSFGFGCGGSDSTSTDSTATGGSDTTSTGGSSNTGGTTAATGGTTASVMCGGVACPVPPIGEACCDTTASPEACGTALAAAGVACMATPEPVANCPGVGFDQFAPPCCTADNLCGIAFGGMCTDLVTLNQGGGMAGGMTLPITIPAPVDCDGNPVAIPDGGEPDASDADAGM